MADFLGSIMEQRREDARRAQRKISRATLLAAAQGRVRRSLAERLARRSGRAIIAEMKKASPSAGLLRALYRPSSLARNYEAAGAAALSVLTEPRFFRGSGDHVRRARSASNLPILRKDFIGESYQLAEAVAWGADVVLLIVAALDPGELRALHQEALGLGLETLVETHTEAELDIALELDQAILGVNSRNLKTLRTDLDVACRMAARIPPARLSVAESGIRQAADIERLSALGYSGFLVGETLMRARHPESALKTLLQQ